LADRPEGDLTVYNTVGSQPGLRRSGGLNRELIPPEQPVRTAIPSFAIPGWIQSAGASATATLMGSPLLPYVNFF
jgi:hypothetical protein